MNETGICCQHSAARHSNGAKPEDVSPSSSSWPWWILPTNSCGLKLVLTVHAQIFNSSQLKQKILNATLNIPQPEHLPADDQPMPYFLIGDDAFALRQWMMKPYVIWTTFRGYTTIAAPGPDVWWKYLRGVCEQIPVPPDVSSPVARACTADCDGRHLPAQSHAHTVPWSTE